MGIDVDARQTGSGTMRLWSPQALRASLSGNALVRHNALLFAANMGTSLVSYLYHPVAGHLLGPSGYGSLASLGALFAVLLIPGQIVVYIANKFAADLTAQGLLGQVNYLLRLATRYAFLVGLMMTVGLITLSPVLTKFLRLPSTHLVIIMSLGFTLTFSGPINFGVIQGRQQFGWFAAINFLTAFLRLVAAIVILELGFGITGLLLATAANGVVIYALSFVPLRDVLRGPRERIPSYRPLFMYSLGATLALGASTLLLSTDTILVKHFLSADDAGYYTALAKMGQTVLFIGGSMVAVMFPKVAALQQQGRPHRGVLAWTMGGVTVLSAIVLLTFWLFPSQIITLIFHAPAQVTRQLFWYGLAMLMLALANVLIYYYLSLGRMAIVPLLLCCCALQAAFIVIWHGSIAQVVMVMIAVMAILLSGLIALFVVETLQARRKPRTAWVA